MPITVNDAQGNRAETLDSYVAALGTSEVRTRVWCEIYRGKKKTKTVSEIAAKLGLDNKTVLTHGLHLAQRHVVMQGKAVPRGGGALETAYTKTSFGLAHRDQILRQASKPKAQIRQSPQSLHPVQVGSGNRAKIKKAAPRSPRRAINVLFAMATPAGQHPLRLDAEAKKVLEHVRRSNFRDKINIIQSPAVDTDSLQQGLNDHRPAIVHFSGHGGNGALWMDDGRVSNSVGSGLSFEIFAKVIGATDTPPKVVVLNACHSHGASDALIEAGALAVIAMSDSISDEAATTFSTKFYAGIASDQSLAASFAQAKVALEATGLVAEADTPIMQIRDGLDAAKMRLLG